MTLTNISDRSYVESFIKNCSSVWAVQMTQTHRRTEARTDAQTDTHPGFEGTVIATVLVRFVLKFGMLVLQQITWVLVMNLAFQFYSFAINRFFGAIGKKRQIINTQTHKHTRRHTHKHWFQSRFFPKKNCYSSRLLA